MWLPFFALGTTTPFFFWPLHGFFGELANTNPQVSQLQNNAQEALGYSIPL